MKMHVWVLSVIISGGIQSVFAEQPMDGMQMQQKTEQVNHAGVGKVVAVDKTNLNVKLEHEAIKSLNWPGMTMNFKVLKAEILEGIKAGDVVNFELKKNIQTGKWLVIRITPKI